LSRTDRRTSDCLAHVLEAIERIERYTSGLTYETFVAD
jgi:uncharacterized protein with HEPN domain